jgi:hypothetical protein
LLSAWALTTNLQVHRLIQFLVRFRYSLNNEFYIVRGSESPKILKTKGSVDGRAEAIVVVGMDTI